MVRILQKPHFEIALIPVKRRQATKKIEENRLDNFFRFPRIVDNAHRDTKDQLVITVEKNG
jgi:hypothetical protein